MTLVVSPNVVLLWFLCQLPGLGYGNVSRRSGNRVYWTMRIAYLAPLLLLEEAFGAGRHWLGEESGLRS